MNSPSCKCGHEQDYHMKHSIDGVDPTEMPGMGPCQFVVDYLPMGGDREKWVVCECNEFVLVGDEFSN